MISIAPVVHWANPIVHWPRAVLSEKPSVEDSRNVPEQRAESPESLLDFSLVERAGPATAALNQIHLHADSFKSRATFVGGCALASTLNRRIVSWAAVAPKSAKARPGNPVGQGRSFQPDQTPFPSCESTAMARSGPRGFVAPCRNRMATAGSYQRRKNSCIWWDAVTQKPILGPGFVRARPRRSSRGCVAEATYWTNSPHFWTDVSPDPQGMMGTEEVEFLGDPSINLSE
jgi:hypothetical protein